MSGKRVGNTLRNHSNHSRSRWNETRALSRVGRPRKRVNRIMNDGARASRSPAVKVTVTFSAKLQRAGLLYRYNELICMAFPFWSRRLWAGCCCLWPVFASVYGWNIMQLLVVTLFHLFGKGKYTNGFKLSRCHGGRSNYLITFLRKMLLKKVRIIFHVSLCHQG